MCDVDVDVLRSATHSWVQYRSEETEKDVLQDMEAADSRAPHAGKHVRTVSSVNTACVSSWRIIHAFNYYKKHLVARMVESFWVDSRFLCPLDIYLNVWGKCGSLFSPKKTVESREMQWQHLFSGCQEVKLRTRLPLRDKLEANGPVLSLCGKHSFC